MAGKSEIVVCQAINFAIAPFVHFRRASAGPGRMRGYRLAYDLDLSREGRIRY